MTTTEAKHSESLISYALIGGLVLSVGTEIAGIILYYQQSGSFNFDYTAQWEMSGPNFFAYAVNLFYASGSLQPTSIMALGIVFLMLTSFVRVLSTLVYFAFVKNAKYSIITLFVLLVLTLTLLVH